MSDAKIPRVGFIVTWDIFHNRKPKADLVHAMKSCGYPQHIIDAVPDFDQAAEVRKAGARWTSGRGKTQDKYFTKSPVYEDDDCIEIGILKEIRKDNHTVDREQVDRIRFLKATGTWDYNFGITSQSISLKRHIEKALLGFDGSIILECCIRPILKDCSSVSIRRKGGVEFVLGEFKKELEMVKSLVEGVGENVFTVLPVAPTRQGNSDAAQHVKKSARREIDELSEKISGWTESGRKVRSDSEELTMSQLETIGNKIKMYEVALSADMSHIKELAEEVRKKAKQILEEQEKKAERWSGSTTFASMDEFFSEAEWDQDNEERFAHKMRVMSCMLSELDATIRSEVFEELGLQGVANEEGVFVACQSAVNKLQEGL
jgi:hypothetical protein